MFRSAVCPGFSIDVELEACAGLHWLSRIWNH